MKNRSKLKNLNLSILFSCQIEGNSYGEPTYGITLGGSF